MVKQFELAERDVKYLALLIPFIKGVDVSKAKYFSYSTKKKLLEQFLFGKLTLDEKKIRRYVFLYESEAVPPAKKGLLGAIADTAMQIVNGIVVGAASAVMTSLLTSLLSKMLGGIGISLLVESEKLRKKRKKILAEASNVDVGVDQSLLKEIREIKNDLKSLYDENVKHFTKLAQRSNISQIDRDYSKYLLNKYRNAFGNFIKKLEELERRYKEGEISKEAVLSALNKIEKEYMEKDKEFRKILSLGVQKGIVQIPEDKREQVLGEAKPDFVQRILARISGKILNVCNEIIEKYKDKPDDWRYKLAVWIARNSNKFFDRVALYWKTYAIVLTLLLLLILYLSTKKIPFISGLAKAIIKVLTAPFRLLWKVVTWVLRKLGIIKIEEVKASIT